MSNKIIVLLAISLLCTNTVVYAKTKYGITVSQCSFDYDDENFCSDKNMKNFANVMKNRKPNFVQNKILYIYKSSNSVLTDKHSSYRMVVIDKNKKTAQPFYWGFNPADTAVNQKGERLEFVFNKTEPKFCVKANIEAYRNAYNYNPEHHPQFCFPYVGDNHEHNISAGFGWFE